ncbi:GspH/FimT family pseudopilin [Luteibacter sp. NPDC031894]|uniref:GspH/FimT family pseudopilin n=1 Tax=Luteibacter sp. NPDC031894 TaxID=3390572 RepID=UPI003D03EDBB
MPRLRLRGFTLAEVLVVLAVSALVGSLALPALSDAIARHRLRAAADDLLETLQNARSMAVWRDRGTIVCASSDGRTCTWSADWSGGWIGRARSGATVFTSSAALDGKLAALHRSGRHGVDFTRNGTSPGTNQTVVLCVRGRPSTAVSIVIGNAGRPHRQPAAPDDAAQCARATPRTR